MTRTIDLYDGLYALYYLGSDYYNGTDNHITDKSGNQRHASPAGSVTVGVSGYGEFEAARFDGDGSGDEIFAFNASDAFQQGPQTWFALYRSETTAKKKIVGNNGNSGNLRFMSVDNKADFGIFDTNKESHTSSVYAPTGEWNHIVGRFDGDNTFITNGKQSNTNNFTGTINRGGSYHIGDFGYQSDEFLGEIAVVGAWSRCISDLEAQYLTQVTGPRMLKL